MRARRTLAEIPTMPSDYEGALAELAERCLDFVDAHKEEGNGPNTALRLGILCSSVDLTVKAAYQYDHQTEGRDDSSS